MSTVSSSTLPPTMRALVCPAKGQPLSLQSVPTPQPTSGSVIVRVLAASFDKSIGHILSAQGPFTFPEPFVPGSRSIGRVVATGPDATTLQNGQLVFIDPFIIARDNPDIQALFGIFDGPTSTGRKWVADNWRNGGYAEYVSAPLENVYPLNEDVLCNQLKYSIPELIYLPYQVVAYGGFRGINLQAGERVIIAPATGGYSGAAIGVAIAMGTTVVAAGRSMAKLQEVQRQFPTGRVHLVELTGDVKQDTARLTAFGPVDAYLDLSPAQASSSTHVRSCFNALRQYGRASLMGVLNQDIAIPYVAAVFKNLTIRGQYMYERSDVRGVIKLIESGVLKLGKEIGCQVAGAFKLEEFADATKCAEENQAYGQLIVLTPSA